MKNYFEEIGLWPRSHKIAGAYVWGFAVSLVLTLLAYELVTQHTLSYPLLVGAIITAAIIQFVVQVYCFLHIGPDSDTRERLFALLFAGLIIFILIAGSLWIMFDLNGRMTMDTAQMEQYMNDQVGF